MRVVIDQQERRSRVFQLLLDCSSIDARVERLAVGDYRIDDRLLVERKTIDDFVRSVRNARIFRQARALSHATLPGLLILEGRQRRRLGREQLQGALVTLTLVFNLPILRSTGPEETVWLLRTLSGQITRTKAKGFMSRTYNPQDRNARRVHMLTALPRVGPKRAVRLLNHFGSVNAVMCASERELATIPGIGAPTARRIRAFLDQPLSDEVEI